MTTTTPVQTAAHPWRFAGEGTSGFSNDGAARIVRASAKNGPLTAAAHVVVPGSPTAPYGVESVALSPDGAVLYACTRRAATAPGNPPAVILTAYHVANGRVRVLGKWNSHQAPCVLAMAPSGRYALVTGIFTAPAPYAYRVNLSSGKASSVGRALTPGQPPGDNDPYTIAW